ncbi:hypothetical protein C8R44DRAFT_885832 [Mycena epipterygia]|nr:hypothetical protein C8R44DRAFT_885832 [Mycena epipterygia]
MSNIVYLSDIRPRPRFFVELDLHHLPNLCWLFEYFVEALGVFFYTYCGVGSQASYVLGNILKASGDSSILQIGLAYAEEEKERPMEAHSADRGSDNNDDNDRWCQAARAVEGGSTTFLANVSSGEVAYSRV